jgi:hypothetical protein
VARPEGTVDVPRRHRDVTLSQLVFVLLLWLVTWRHGVVIVVADVVGACRGGWRWSNGVCERWWLLVDREVGGRRGWWWFRSKKIVCR